MLYNCVYKDSPPPNFALSCSIWSVTHWDPEEANLEVKFNGPDVY